MHAHSLDFWRHEHVFLGQDHARNERRSWAVVEIPIAFNEAIPLAAVGLLVNLLSALLLHDGHGQDHAAHRHHGDDQRHHHHHHHADHNLRAAYIHVIADAAVSMLVLIGLTVGRLLGWIWLDPVMGIVGMLVIANWSWNLIRASGAVLLDMRTGDGITSEIAHRLEAGRDDRVSDLHVWRVGPGHCAAVVSLVSDQPEPPASYTCRDSWSEPCHC
jgi:cation diffusion facilitator family transporter